MSAPVKRVRLLKVMVQVVAVVDDGTDLAEAPTQPIEVSAADWPHVLDLVDQGLTSLQQHLNDGADDA